MIYNAVSIKNNNGGSYLYLPDLHTILDHEREQEDRVEFISIDADPLFVTEKNKLLKDHYDKKENDLISAVPYLAFCTITNKCNMECSFCYANKNADQYEGKFQVKWIEQLKQQLPKQSFAKVVISGGEPFLEYDLLKEIRTHFDEAIIYTNGSLITEEIVEYLIESNTKIYVALDYKIHNFEGHDAEKIRERLNELCIKYPDFKQLIEISIVYPNDELDKLQDHRCQATDFEKDVKHDFNYVMSTKDVEISTEFFEKECERIETEEITFNSSVFQKPYKQLVACVRDYIKAESCSATININYRGDITICHVLGSTPTIANYQDKVLCHVDDFSLGKYFKYAFENKKVGLCELECNAKFFCGNICWANIKYNRHNCDIEKKSIFYMLYLALNYSDIDVLGSINIERIIECN